jgi:hypothetical protein
MKFLAKNVVPLLRKVGIEVVNVLVNNAITFFVFKKLGLFQAVFVMYPANASYADHFTFRWRQRRIKFTPFVIGMFTHPSGSRTLSFAISADENEIRASSSPDELRGLNDRTTAIADTIGAKTVHYAGIIPGRMNFLRVPRSPVEQEATKEQVVRAVASIKQKLDLLKVPKVILLGHKGYVGREVFATLLKQGVDVVGVDVGDTFFAPDEVHVVLNVTKPEAINRYIDHFNRHTILLNEVYPAPHRDILKQIKERGVSAFHIAGVKSDAFPPFPAAYKGAVPCCGAIPGENYEIVFKEL